jgi:acyl carrier protein
VSLRSVLDFDAFCERIVYEFALAPPIPDLRPTTQLATDLGCDSLLLLEIVLFVEDLAGVVLSEQTISGIFTLGDLFAVYTNNAR